MCPLTSFRATQTVYRATSLKMCSSSRRRTNSCTRVRTFEKLADKSSSRSATRPHLLAVTMGGVGGTAGAGVEKGTGTLDLGLFCPGQTRLPWGS